jgi:hypothetical protein
MRAVLITLAALCAVACSKGEVRSDQHKADASLSSAAQDVKEVAKKTGDQLKVATDKAKPDIDRLGKKAEVQLKAAGKDVKKAVHEATADSSEPASSNQE